MNTRIFACPGDTKGDTRVFGSNAARLRGTVASQDNPFLAKIRPRQTSIADVYYGNMPFRRHTLSPLVLACLGCCFVALTLIASRAVADPPPNDNFANAQVLTGSSGSGSGTTVDATVESGEPNHDGWPPADSVWYAWTAPSDGTFFFTVSYGGENVGAYMGDAVDALAQVGAFYHPYVQSTGWTFTARAGVTYHISVNYGGAGAPFTFNWQFIARPSNDSSANAQFIDGDTGSVSGDTEAATVESGEPHASDGNSVWFVWTAPRDGSFRFDVKGQIVSYHIYTGNSLSSLTEVFAPAYYPGVRVASGQQYLIQVSGVSNGAPSDPTVNGTFTITWAPGPANDDFEKAARISGDSGSVNGNIRGGTEEPGEPTIAGYPAAQSVWYQWNAPASGWYSFTAKAQFVGSLVAAYTGSSISDLQRVASNLAGNGAGNIPNAITFHADAGVTYSIAVATLPSLFDVSDFTLSWKAGTSAADATLLNLSTRAHVGLDTDALIGGFIITGNAPKKLIVRAIGPSMQSGGTPVEGRLLDPTLELHDSYGAVIFTNDNWVDSPQKQAIIASTVPPNDDNESAIIATVAPGAYTAVVRGANGGTGIGLMEIYDLDVASDSRLANVSTRGHVDTGANVMIGGLIIGGSLPTKVAVRALGPSLANATPPLPGALTNPSVEVRDSSNTPFPLAQNTDWNDPQVTAAGLAPSNAKEAALITTLNPGNYTAIVKGENNTTGVGLIEIYNLQ